MSRVIAFFRGLRGDQWLLLSAGIVLSSALLLALPSLLVPLGLPPEGDAVDYRVPLLQWILRHGALPNWQWSMVDDYPLFSEILMVPLYAVSPALARLVPIAGYFALALAGGSLLVSFPLAQSGSRRALFALGAAWVVALRPVAIQSNLLMIDNISAAFLLGSMAAIFRRRFYWAGLLAAGAMATRYTSWASALFLVLLCYLMAEKGRRIRESVIFCLIAAIGPLPVMMRNFLLNHGHPFFPLDAPAVLKSVAASNYGRGTGVLDFFLLPWDLLVTNSFVEAIYDYSLGKLFYLQICAVVAMVVWGKYPSLKISRELKLGLGFAFFHLVVWFYSSQQLRFLTPTLVIVDLCFLLFLLRVMKPQLVALLTLAGLFSVLSIQKDSLLIVMGRKETIFEQHRLAADACLQRAGVLPDQVLGFSHRNGVLGFLNRDFVFVSPHPYAIPTNDGEGPRWILHNSPRPGYEPWPKVEPCLLRRVDFT